MSFLPIVERELRIAARRRLTYWARLYAAGFLLLIFGMVMLIFSSVGAFLNRGQMAFNWMKWITFIYAASMGVFMPADALSEEKREGTLGLLFLTDLRGYDVVLGKLICISLQSFYGMVAVCPILALPLLVGGVTIGEFWRTILALCDTLFLSVVLGLFVSSMNRELLKAMNAAFFANLFFIAGLPWLDLALVRWDPTKFRPVLSLASPGFLFVNAPQWHSSAFWYALVLQFLLGWMLLIITSLIVPRSWQEKSSDNTGFWANLNTWLRFGGKQARLAFRKKVLGGDPMLWISLRDDWLRKFAFAVTFLLTGSVAWSLCSNWGKSATSTYAYTSHLVLYLLITLWISSQACRTSVEGVRSGVYELILVAPMSPRQIVRSQWLALFRTFWLPVLLVALIGVATETSMLVSTMKAFPKGTTASASGGIESYYVMDMIFGAINFVLLCAALGCFGLWMGLRTRKISVAILKTFVFVLVVPFIIGIFIQMMSMFMFSGMMSGYGFWIGVIPAALFETLKNILFILWARVDLLHRFRWAVAEAGQRVAHKTEMLSNRVPGPVAPLISAQ